MNKECKAPFDSLPDELISKIFGYMIGERENLTSLRLTCKRFCMIINRNLLTQPNCAVQEPYLNRKVKGYPINAISV
jgi:hypothetical protein